MSERDNFEDDSPWKSAFETELGRRLEVEGKILKMATELGLTESQTHSQQRERNNASPTWEQIAEFVAHCTNPGHVPGYTGSQLLAQFKRSAENAPDHSQTIYKVTEQATTAQITGEAIPAWQLKRACYEVLGAARTNTIFAVGELDAVADRINEKRGLTETKERTDEM